MRKTSKSMNESLAQAEELTHIIALTAFTNENTINECLSVGMKRVLNKPITIENLHYAVWRHFYRINMEEYKIMFHQQYKKECILE
jgi:CheY-like chemotaxis protein